MKVFLLLALVILSFSASAQVYRTVDAPVGFLRDEPKVTATIIFKIEENARVKVIEEISKTWLKVEYKHNSTLLIGYITNHTLDDNLITEKSYMQKKDKSVAK